MEDDGTKIKELLAILTKLTLKTAHEVAMLMSVVFMCFCVQTEESPAKEIKLAYITHAARTKGKSGHRDGSPDGPALVALIIWIASLKTTTAEDKTIITSFLSNCPPPTSADYKSPEALQKAVPICRLQKMKVSTTKKLFIRLVGHADLESIIEKALSSTKNHQFFGQAPKGALERRAQILMQELDLDTNTNLSEA